MNCRLNYLYERFPNNPDFAAHLEKIELEIWNTLKNENFPRFQYEGVNYFTLSSKNTKEYKHQMKVLQNLRDKWGSQELFLMKKLPPFDYSLIQVGIGKIVDKQFEIFNSQSLDIKEVIENDFDEEVFNKYQKIKNTANISQEITTEQTNQIEELKQSDPRWNKYSNEDIQRFIDSVFPDSKVKNIVYHGTDDVFEQFDKSKFRKNQEGNGLMFSGTITSIAKEKGEQVEGFYFLKEKTNNYGKIVLPVLLNIKNPKNFGKNIETMFFGDINPTYEKLSFVSSEELKEYTKDNIDGLMGEVVNVGNEVVVFEPEQIYILNSDRAISDMEKFVNNKKDNNFEEDVSCFI